MIHQLISLLDNALQTLSPPNPRLTTRAYPALKMEEPSLRLDDKRHIAGLMRVNHAGEVCAQALYTGQAMTAQLADVRGKMQEAADEEVDHLSWCETRLSELGYSPSLLNPIWYGGSFLLGAMAGLAGDQYSLGFVAETEHQVHQHLQSHIDQLPESDVKTKEVLKKMQEDEAKHAKTALESGGQSLPTPIKIMMSLVAKVMTQTSYYL